jgi:hypothetical protein
MSPRIWEAEEEGSLECRSLRPDWAIYELLSRKRKEKLL